MEQQIVYEAKKSARGYLPMIEVKICRFKTNQCEYGATKHGCLLTVKQPGNHEINRDRYVDLMLMGIIEINLWVIQITIAIKIPIH